jgi:hypothetical protein
MGRMFVVREWIKGQESSLRSLKVRCAYSLYRSDCVRASHSRMACVPGGLTFDTRA